MDYAFEGCESLTSIAIPNSVTSIGSGAFQECFNLTSVIIPNSVTTIDSFAFSYCRSLTSVTIPDGVTSIGDNAFENCNLTSVTIGNGVTSIGSYAFRNCDGLTSVNIPNSVTTIGEDAFYGVLNINYNGTATGSPWGAMCINGYIEDGLVYSDNTKTTLVCAPSNITGSVTIPNSVTTIGDYAFYDCSGLMSVTIPDSVTTISDYAFYDCSGLMSVTIPDSVTTIGDYAFYNVLNINYNGTATGSPWGARYINGYVEAGLVYTDNTKTILVAADKNITRSVTIPNSVTTIGDYAFAACNKLTSVTLPYFVTTIGDYAFYHCTGLTSVTIPDRVTSIGEYAFNYCTHLTSITCEPTTPPTMSSGVFNNTNNCPICVPAASVDTYKAANNWSTYKTRIYASNSTKPRV